MVHGVCVCVSDVGTAVGRGITAWSLREDLSMDWLVRQLGHRQITSDATEILRREVGYFSWWYFVNSEKKVNFHKWLVISALCSECIMRLRFLTIYLVNLECLEIWQLPSHWKISCVRKLSVVNSCKHSNVLDWCDNVIAVILLMVHILAHRTAL